MKIFQRSIHSTIREDDERKWIVNSDFLDLEHSIHLELTIDTKSGEVISASAQMSKSPFTRCMKALEGVRKLEGMKIERGILSLVHKEFSGHKSCTHLMELIIDSIRLVGMMRVGGRAGYPGVYRSGETEDEKIARITPKLKNTCLVFTER
ncbi:MAG: hypothetical protein C0609_12460 [Deltaproteobacteria bacterium]|nr:MAG: hypothetical protein C0609_12460 [Deltaproteobacteria bacterium]